MGDDFAFYKSEETFQFIDNFKNLMEHGQDYMKFIYSSPRQYMEAVQKELEEKKMKLPVYKDDFLPLLMQFRAHYWSGYYTSRPNFKKLLRELTY